MRTCRACEATVARIVDAALGFSVHIDADAIPDTVRAEPSRVVYE